LFGETPDIVTEGLARLLFTAPEILRVTRAHVGPLEVPFEHSHQAGGPRATLERCPIGIGEAVG
jgi:hypothetical protein